MAKETFFDPSAKGYSVVQLTPHIRCWNAGLLAGSYSGGLGDGATGRLCYWLSCRGLELAGGSLAHQWDHRGGAAAPDDLGSQNAQQVNDHLLQERLKRWYPEWQFTFRKFSPIKGFLFNESLPLHSEWFMAGFKMYCFDYACTLWTL